jgi:hypothetical protein
VSDRSYYSSPALRCAYAIGRVIAEKTVKEDPILQRMDGLGKAAAIHDMASRMQQELILEGAAAYAEACKIQDEDAAVAEVDPEGEPEVEADG